MFDISASEAMYRCMSSMDTTFLFGSSALLVEVENESSFANRSFTASRKSEDNDSSLSMRWWMRLLLLGSMIIILAVRM